MDEKNCRNITYVYDNIEKLTKCHGKNKAWFVSGWECHESKSNVYYLKKNEHSQTGLTVNKKIGY